MLYDPREGSPTKGMVNEIYLTECNRGLLTISPYVIHAVQNIGTFDAVWINMPTLPYNHDKPDEVRVSATSGEVPYSFDTGPGW